MMTNSMRRYIDPDFVVGMAAMSVSRLRIKGTNDITIILVEGSLDQKVFTVIANRPNCVIVLADGKNNAIEALHKLLQKYRRGIIAIIDADYDLLVGNHTENPNVVITDTHDTETMILASPALRKYLSLLLPKERLYLLDDLTRDVRKKLIEIGKPLGLLRWEVYERRCRLGFRDISFDEIIDINNFQLDLNKITDKWNNSGISGNCIKEKILNGVEQKMEKNYDPWLICQGHDLVSILIKILPRLLLNYIPLKTDIHRELFQKMLSEKASSHQLVSDWLMACYEMTHFKNTDMYKKIRKWEVNNKPHKVLA